MPVSTVEGLPMTCGAASSDGFTSFQWLVIAIGARDGTKPLQWSPIGRLLLTLVGGGPQPLASPCLESLRRTASLARHHGWAIPAAEIGAFLGAGWSEEQLEQLIESVGPTDPFIDEWRPCEPVAGELPGERRSQDRTLMETVQ
jgi:hypothetical protein